VRRPRDENKPRDIADIESTVSETMLIPDCTKFVIVDVDRDNGRVQIKFALDDQVMRAWVAAEHFEKTLGN